MNTTHYGLLDSSHSLFLLYRHSVGTRDQTSEGLYWLGRSPFFVVGHHG